MPNAATYRQFADRLEKESDALLAAMARVDKDWGPHVVSGGKLGADAQRTVDASRANVSRSVAQIHVMVTECRLKATLSDSYAQQMRDWRTACVAYDQAWSAYVAGQNQTPPTGTHPGVRPQQPAKPHPQVDE